MINCSQRSAELHAKLGYSAVPNSVIPNGYDPLAFHPDERAREVTRQSLGIDPGTFLIGSFDDALNCPDKAGQATGLPDIPSVTSSNKQTCAPISFLPGNYYAFR